MQRSPCNNPGRSYASKFAKKEEGRSDTSHGMPAACRAVSPSLCASPSGPWVCVCEDFYVFVDRLIEGARFKHFMCVRTMTHVDDRSSIP